jgi:hypothetical protein
VLFLVGKAIKKGISHFALVDEPLCIMHGCLMVRHRPSDSLGKRCLFREILERIGTNHLGNDQTSHRLGIFLES